MTPSIPPEPDESSVNSPAAFATNVQAMKITMDALWMGQKGRISASYHETQARQS